MSRLMLLLTGSCGLFAGILLGGHVKDWGKVAAMGGLAATPICYVAHTMIDSKATRKVRQAEKKANEAVAGLEQAKNQVADKENEILGLIASLRDAQGKLSTSNKEALQLKEALATFQPLLTQLEQLQTSLTHSKAHIEELEAECDAWESEFDTRVAKEVNERYQEARKGELERIFQESDSVTQQAMELFKRLQNWGEKVAHGHQAKREIIVNLANQYNANLDELNASVDRERGEYLNQIELLREKVAVLQHELAGDLVEPEYLQCGFDPNGKVANALAEWLWHHRKIPLKVTGFEVSSDGVVTAGYVYPRSMPVEALVKTLEDDSPVMSRNLGLYSVEKPHKLAVCDCLTVKVRRERPARKADKGSLYRSSEEFIKYILSQPVRLRIVGEPGAGKTPTVAVLLSHILKRGFLEANTPNGRKLPYCVVESCNPLAGISVKNGDELDFCLTWNSGAKGFKGLAEEYRFRKNPTNADYKNQVGYIWIADEIDNSMADLTKDEAKPFKDSLKDGGHVNLGVIVMGQSANISTSKGLSIDDQKMMTNLYIDPVSIRTFLTQYGERFYSKRAVEKALATLEELELEIEEKNEVICDTAREFRIAMVTASRSPVFYQLPYFDSVDINLEAYQQMLAEVALIRASRQQHGATTDKSQPLPNMEIASTVASAGATPTQVSCPKCASTVKRNGKTSTGTQKYLCKSPDCKHGFVI